MPLSPPLTIMEMSTATTANSATATPATAKPKKTRTVKAQPEAATMPVETALPVTSSTAAPAEYTSEKIGHKVIKGNVGNTDKMTVHTNAEGEKFLTFDLCVNGKDEHGQDVKTWFTVRTSHVKLIDVIRKGDLLEVVGNHFINTRNTDGKKYNRLNAYKVSFC